jgi:hypothetical protein
MIKATLGVAILLLAPPIGVPFVWEFPMRAPSTLWHQIHELANLVDRHAVEGQSVHQLVAALHALPTATRQNVQRDLHLLSRWLHMLTQKQTPEPLSGIRRTENHEAKELARSLSQLDNDGSPIPTVVT